MEIIPAIDLRWGKVVRLHQGDYDRQVVYSDDPLDVALEFQESGASRLHVVDLDGAAAGTPINLGVVSGIVARVDIPVQMGGGIRTLDMVAKMLGMGVGRIVFGTAAVKDPDLVREVIARHGPQAVVVGVDARDGVVAVQGWQEQTSVTAVDLIQHMRELGVPRFIYTDILRDGTLTGPNFEAIAPVVQAADAAMLVSGGISSIDHLRHLAEMGVEGTIIGSALYQGMFTLPEAIAAASG